MTCVQSEVLQTVVNEFSNLSNETSNVFFFDEKGETIVVDQATREDQAKPFIDDFVNLTLQTDVLGGLENLAIQGVQSQIQVARIENLYLALVSSREANAKIIDSLSHVLVPTIVKLLNQQPIKEEMEIPQDLEIEKEEVPFEESVLPEIEPVEENTLPEVEAVEESVLPEEEVVEEEQLINGIFEEESSESLLPDPPINQLMVEKIKGILVQADTVRVDSEVIAKWTELYGERDLLVHIQTLEGKETTCKFKPLKDAKSNAKGIIQIPEKILEALHASKGQLVMVSPEIS